MYQIKSYIKVNSNFVIYLLLFFSCAQNPQEKVETPPIIILENKFAEDFKKVKDFNELANHLNQYDSLWRKTIPSTIDFDFVKEMASELARVQNKGTLGQVPEDLILETLKGIPVEGGLREVFLDIWLEAQVKPKL
jgi:hypothetical protein